MFSCRPTQTILILYIGGANHYTYLEAGMYIAFVRLAFSRVFYFRGNLKENRLF